jgi:outer membrane protein OmpA-like peptidoglycan-associated protein
MAMTRKVLAAALAASLVLAVAARAEDEEGTKEHPGVKRYPGSRITRQVDKEFEFFLFPVSASKAERAEGKFYWASWEFPSTASCTQIVRNYESALRKGRMTVYTGTEVPELEGIPEDFYAESWVTGIGPGKSGGQVYVTQSCYSGDPPTGVLAVVETQAMAQKVEVTSDAMGAEIERTGRVALYGIHFATARADIEAESARELEEIARLLEARPDWKLRVEGHTDAVGKPKENLALSRRRAAAVKEWLVSRHGIDAARLATEGYGDARPVAANDSEAGRAKNRRVELSKL